MRADLPKIWPIMTIEVRLRLLLRTKYRHGKGMNLLLPCFLRSTGRCLGSPSAVASTADDDKLLRLSSRMARPDSASKDPPFQKSFHRNLPVQAISPGPEVGTDQLGTFYVQLLPSSLDLSSLAVLLGALCYRLFSPWNVGLLNGNDDVVPYNRHDGHPGIH